MAKLTKAQETHAEDTIMAIREILHNAELKLIAGEITTQEMAKVMQTVKFKARDYEWTDENGNERPDV